MTTALRYDEATALSASVDVQQVSARMSVFLAEELLPLMAGLWPASANQLDSNARGVALAWGSILKGFNAQQIREAVLQLGEDVERQFAPRPAEVRAVIVKAAPAAMVAQGSPCISIRACEVIAEARVFQRERAALADAVAWEMELVLAEKARQGVTVTGKVI